VCRPAGDGRRRRWRDALARLLRRATSRAAAGEGAGEGSGASDDAQLARLLDRIEEPALRIGDDGRIVGFNAGAERLLGLPAPLALGRPARQLLSDRRLSPLDLGGSSGALQGAALRGDGEWVPVELSVSRPAEGWRLVFLRDVGERCAAEDVLREARELAELARRSKTEFVANMSHELRTPLNAILGFAEIIRDQLVGPVGNPVYAEYAKDIHDSGSHLLQVINDILDIAKIEAGRMSLAEEPVLPAVTASSCLRLLRQRANQAGVQLVDQTDEALASGLVADEPKLKQMLFNVLGNAIKFTPGGGRVTVRIEVTPEAELAIEVSDTGIGIAAEDFERIMEPFGQASASLDRRYEGTGLGLPLTRSLVELHGGRIEIRSEVGRGTTVRLVFPASRVIPGLDTRALRAS
jgi:signal transduction histidine kinase